MRTFTVNQPRGINPCIQVTPLPFPSDNKRLGIYLSQNSYVLLDREKPASVVWVGDGHPVIRTAQVAPGPVLTLSQHGLSLDQEPDALVLLDYWLIPDHDGFSTCNPRQGCLLIGSAPVEEAKVEIGWEHPDQHNRFQADAWRIRELVQFSVDGYQKVSYLGGQHGKAFPYSTYYLEYAYSGDKPKSNERPRLKLFSEEAFRRAHPEKAMA